VTLVKSFRKKRDSSRVTSISQHDSSHTITAIRVSLMMNSTFYSNRVQWRSQPKNLGGAKKLGGAKMFDIRWKILFCLEKRLSKHKMIIFSKNFWGAWPLWPSWIRLWPCHVTDSRRKSAGGPVATTFWEIVFYFSLTGVTSCFSSPATLSLPIWFSFFIMGLAFPTCSPFFS